MSSVTEFLNGLIPITQFNRGQASRIFDRLQSEKRLIVLKNNQPAAIILSPEEYTRLNEMEEDYYLLLEATERLARNSSPTLSTEEVMKELGITEKELEDTEVPVIE